MFTNDTIFIKTLESYASDDAAEPDAGTGCRGRCVYARRDGPELHVGSFACHADSVYPDAQKTESLYLPFQ